MDRNPESNKTKFQIIIFEYLGNYRCSIKLNLII